MLITLTENERGSISDYLRAAAERFKEHREWLQTLEPGQVSAHLKDGMIQAFERQEKEAIRLSQMFGEAEEVMVESEALGRAARAGQRQGV